MVLLLSSQGTELGLGLVEAIVIRQQREDVDQVDDVDEDV